MNETDTNVLKAMLIRAYRNARDDKLTVADQFEVRAYHIGYRDALINAVREVHSLKGVREEMIREDWPKGIGRVL